MELIAFLPGAIAAIPTMHYLTHPNKLKNRIPKIKVSRFELSPNIRISFRGRQIWLHHWLNFAILLGVSIPVTNGILDAHFTKGFLMGGILQGLLYPDRYKFIIPKGRKNIS